MRDTLPKKSRINESAIVNLDEAKNSGTHWVAFRKNKNNVHFFDPMGNLCPPAEIMKYSGVGSVKYNHEKFQSYNTFTCGHLCLKFLNNSLYKDLQSPYTISLH